MRTKLIIVSCLLALSAVAAVAQPFRGELTARYRDRWGGADWEDQDAYAYLRLSYGEDEPRPVSGAFSIRYDADLLTRQNEIDDGKNDTRVYYGYLDFHQVKNFDFRLGRQYLDAAEGFHLTGLEGVYHTPWHGLRIGAFAGQPVSYYTTIEGGEKTGGVTFSLRPVTQSNLRGSWIHLEETGVNSDVVTLAYRQAFGESSNFYLTARTLDFEVWNELVGGSWQITPAGFRLNGSYRRQEDTNSSQSRYFGDLATVIGPSLPYQQLTLDVTRPIRDLASVGIGWSRRDLLHSSENVSNQEFDRYFVDLALTEQALHGFEATADFSRWETDHDTSDTLSGSLGHRFGERLRLEIGSVYTKYDLRNVYGTPDEVPQERYDVRSLYLRGDWRVRQHYRVRVEFDRSTDSQTTDPYYTADVLFGLDLGQFFKTSERSPAYAPGAGQ